MFSQMPGLTSSEPVYRLGIGLAAIAARSAFGMKAGAVMTLPLPLIMVMIGRSVGTGRGAGRADVEATGAGESIAMACSAI